MYLDSLILSRLQFLWAIAIFIGAIGLFIILYLNMAISLFPTVIPHQFTLWQTASSPETQTFLLVGTIFLLPVIPMYIICSLWVFRGEVRTDIGYH